MDRQVQQYVESITDSQRKKDLSALIDLLSQITTEPAKMWGTSIIAFGLYHYKYESGREGEAPKIGLSNRKQAIVLYGLGISDQDTPNSKLIHRLGKHKTGKGCVYIGSLADIDTKILEQMVRNTTS